MADLWRFLPLTEAPPVFPSLQQFPEVLPEVPADLIPVCLRWHIHSRHRLFSLYGCIQSKHITATSACSTDSFTCSVVRTPTSQLRCGPCQSCATLFICKFCNFPKVPAWQTGTGNYHNIVCPRCGAEYSRSDLRIPLYEDRLLPVMPVH